MGNYINISMFLAKSKVVGILKSCQKRLFELLNFDSSGDIPSIKHRFHYLAH